MSGKPFIFQVAAPLARTGVFQPWNACHWTDKMIHSTNTERFAYSFA